jgi:transposase
LLGQLGIGPVVAGQVITSWSHHGRVPSEAAFAKLGGAAPIDASSGTVMRHRLNRSGDRQLNPALHTIVLVRMRQDCATKDYVQRRLAQGKTIRDIKRCLIGEVSVMRPGIGLDCGFSVVSGDGLVAEPL